MTADPTKEPRLLKQVEAHPYPLLFATISGAHLYGFPSPDSDFDLRGIHLLPMEELLGLTVSHETIERSGIHDMLEIDLVTHDAKKFFLMLLKKNGYVLEQLLSPLVVRTSAAHEELISLAPGFITRHHAHHYLGFAKNQWDLFAKENPPRVKPLLYVLRVLLTGIHLMRTGTVEANLVHLNTELGLSYVPDLITRKLEGCEKERLTDADMEFFRREFESLLRRLEEAYRDSNLAENPSAEPALNDLLVRIRWGKV